MLDSAENDKFGVHELARTFISSMPALNPVFRKLDDWLGYGQEEDGTKFWNGQ